MPSFTRTVLRWWKTSGPRSRIWPSARSRSPSLSTSTKWPPSQPQYWGAVRRLVVEHGAGGAVVAVDGEGAVAVVDQEVLLDVGAAAALDPQVDVLVAVDVARRGRLDVKVREVRRGDRGRSAAVFPAHRGGEGGRAAVSAAVRGADVELRRVAVSAAVLPDVDARVEHGEVDPTVAVEVVGDHDRCAGPDGPGHHGGRREPEVPAAGPENHPHRQLGETVGGRLRPIVRLAAHDQVVPTVAVEVHDGEDTLDLVEVLPRLAPGKGLGRGRRAKDDNQKQHGDEVSQCHPYCAVVVLDPARERRGGAPMTGETRRPQPSPRRFARECSSSAALMASIGRRSLDGGGSNWHDRQLRGACSSGTSRTADRREGRSRRSRSQSPSSSGEPVGEFRQRARQLAERHHGVIVRQHSQLGERRRVILDRQSDLVELLGQRLDLRRLSVAVRSSLCSSAKSVRGAGPR